MPLFHFHLVAGDKRVHIGSLDLPSHGVGVPAGVRLSIKVLVNIVSAGDGDEYFTVQATDATGSVIYDLDVPRRSEGVRSHASLH